MEEDDGNKIEEEDEEDDWVCFMDKFEIYLYV